MHEHFDLVTALNYKDKTPLADANCIEDTVEWLKEKHAENAARKSLERRLSKAFDKAIQDVRKTVGNVVNAFESFNNAVETAFIDRDKRLMDRAKEAALRSPFKIHRQGCVLVDAGGRVLATGANSDVTAEQEAVMNLAWGDRKKVETCYSTLGPSRLSIELLLETSCDRIVFLKPGLMGGEDWMEAGRVWDQLDDWNNLEGCE